MVKTGIGFDAHKLTAGRKLILGGVEIKYDKGLLGYSDADVVCHAIADALLGAAGLGDIGMMFPDDDPKNKGVSSIKILSEIGNRLKVYKYKIINIDVTIIAQEPRLAPYTDLMKQAIANSLATDKHEINVKAKTTETLGFTGRKEGIASLAIATIEKDEL